MRACRISSVGSPGAPTRRSARKCSMSSGARWAKPTCSRIDTGVSDGASGTRLRNETPPPPRPLRPAVVIARPRGFGARVHRLDFEIDGAARRASIDTLIVAGWTGRDYAAVDLHIDELEAVGVRRPPTVPCFYRLGANLLTQAAAIDVVGVSSSGEVEIVLVSLADGLHVGVGSDHTDRKVEAYSVTVSQQMCPQPIGCELWKFDDVADHWDELVLRSWVTRQKTRSLYQEGSARKILAAPDL